MAEFDSMVLYKSIPLNCQEDEAIAVAGIAPGNHRRGCEGMYMGMGRNWNDGSRKEVCWGFDKGEVVLWVEPDGRVTGKEHRPNIAYDIDRMRDSRLYKILKIAGLLQP